MLAQGGDRLRRDDMSSRSTAIWDSGHAVLADRAALAPIMRGRVETRPQGQLPGALDPYAFASGIATNLMPLLDFTRISTVCCDFIGST